MLHLVYCIMELFEPMSKLVQCSLTKDIPVIFSAFIGMYIIILNYGPHSILDTMMVILCVVASHLLLERSIFTRNSKLVSD